MTDYEQAHRYLRAGVSIAPSTDHLPVYETDGDHAFVTCSCGGGTFRGLGIESDLADFAKHIALLASSTPATASEGATARPGCGSADHWPAPQPAPLATGVTSSDGDRGLSEEVEAIIRAYGAPVTRAGRESLQDTVRSLVDLIVARTAQPEGTERVEWGVQCSAGIYAAGLEFDARLDLASNKHHDDCVGKRVLLRRTVTTYAPVVGEWEVVGDE